MSIKLLETIEFPWKKSSIVPFQTKEKEGNFTAPVK